MNTDDRLRERILGSGNFPDWLEKLEATFTHFDLRYEGGESSKEAMMRGVSVVEEIIRHEDEHTMIVTHGNLLMLILKYYDDTFGFSDWQNLQNPDIFLLEADHKKVHIHHVAFH